RHLMGRSRKVRNRHTAVDFASGNDAQSISRPLSVRDRHRGTGGPGAVLRGVRDVGASLAPADKRREPQGAHSQLRADFRCSAATRPRVGDGERQVNYESIALIGGVMTMTRNDRIRRRRPADGGPCARWLLVTELLLAIAGNASAQDTAQPAAQETKPSVEIYGFAMLDIWHDFKTIGPDWFDTMRVTKLNSFDGQFGENNSSFAGVRQ